MDGPKLSARCLALPNAMATRHILHPFSSSCSNKLFCWDSQWCFCRAVSMVNVHGILKKPARNPAKLDQQSTNVSTSSSYENLLSLTASSSSLPLLASSSASTMIELDRRDRESQKDEEEDLVEVAIHDESSDHEQSHPRHRNTAKVQFPDGLNRPPPLPYPYNRQDSDAMSSRSSLAGPDEDDSDNYDWSDEEDLVDEQAKFGKIIGIKAKQQSWGFTRIISLLFSSLIGSTFLAAIIITPGILIHFYWYKPVPTEHRKYVRDNVQAWLFWAAANLVISWYLAMIIDITPILFRYLISATWGHVSESIKTRIETYDSVKNTAKPAFYAASAFASWMVIFGNIYQLYNVGDNSKSRAQYTNRTEQVVEFFFFLVLIWRVQAMISHFIAFSFHRTAYKERVDEVQKSLVVIEKLRQYRPKSSAHQTPHKSGTRTPVFGFSSTLTDNMQHYRLLSGALKHISHTRMRSDAELSEQGRSSDDGEPSDADPERSSKRHGKQKRRRHGSNSANRFSWLSSPPEPARQDSESTAYAYAYDAQTKPVVAPGGAEVEIEMMPTAPSAGQVYSAAPVTPSHLNPNRYPPSSGSPRTSLDGAGGGGGGGNAADATLRQAAKVLKNAVLHDARNISRGSSEQGTLAWNVNSAHEAKRLARSIFMRFKDRGRTWLVPADFYPAFPDQASASDAFKVFDKDNNGDISRAEIKTTLLKVYKERRFLSRSMRDVGEALRTLDRILLFFAGVVLFFIALSVFGVQVGTSLSSVYTLGIAASFIFKRASSSAFDSIMFLFVAHPYDTGDRILIGTENLVVKKVGLFATVFTRSDGTETYYFNSQLFSQFILNMRRSGKTFENLTMQVAWTTPLVKLDALEKCLNDWLSTEENRWFEPSTNIVLQNISFQRYLEITIGIGHNGNWQDWGLRNARKTAFHAAVQYYCRQLGLVGYEAPLPVVYANPRTLVYQPSSPAPQADEMLSPVSPTNTERQTQQEAIEVQIAAKNMKPTLGFLPPLADRSSHLARVRKSKNRKANLGAGNG
ncbi:Mechanosensitive ion channel-domain-containing protein [Flammula alnicola]|nr:Mechanosensitive ion channel-domain-containing protein [Flammula alnicola]